MRLLLPLLLVTCLSACGFVGFPGVYKIDVEQGNIITQDIVNQLKPGMSRRQVRFILGTPLLEDPFNQSRWDYPYVKRNGNNIISESRLMVYFDGDTMIGVEGDFIPDDGSSDQPEQEAATEADTTS